MTFEVGVVARFDARHHLVGDFGPASQPHAHAYRVEVAVLGGSLREDGTLFDITRLQAALSAVLVELEGRDLNSVVGLSDLNPTAEVVARYFFERIAPTLANDGLDQLRTRVWESDEAWAGYAGDLA